MRPIIKIHQIIQVKVPISKRLIIEKLVMKKNHLNLM